jgi:hypothetical protein
MAEGILGHACDRIAGTERNMRNNTLNAVAYWIGQHRWALGHIDDLENRIRAAARAHFNNDPIRAEEKMTPALRNGASRPLDLPGGTEQRRPWDPNRPRSPGASIPTGPDEGAAVIASRLEPANSGGPPLIRALPHPLPRGRRMNEIGSQTIEWMFAPYIPFGMLTLLCGDPGRLKSTEALEGLAVEMLARGLSV